MLRLNRLVRNEDGNILIGVILISMLVGMLATLTLTTGQQADRASAKDRNREVALGVSEAAVHDGLTRVESLLATQFVTRIPASGDITRTTDRGTYRYNVVRVGDSFVIDAEGTVADGGSLERKRHLRVTLQPPQLFPGEGYALFSKTNLYLKNNNEVFDGDVWSNDSVWAEGGAVIAGSVTSAQSWVKLENAARVDSFVWAGGRRCDVEGQNPCTSGWGISLGQNGVIGGFAKSSLSAPNCAGEDVNAYKVINDGLIKGDLTSLGPMAGSGSVNPGTITTGACTTGQPRKDPPTFTFNRNNYDPATYHEYGMSTGNGAAEFNTALNNNQGGINKQALVGTFVIRECGAGVVNIAGSEIAGNVTIITNPEPCNGVKGARIRTDDIGDSSVPSNSDTKFVLITHYEPPAGTSCSDKDDEFCAVTAKNHFDSTCKTSTLVYADNGSVSMKNSTGPNDNEMCGAVIANGIHMKNNLQLTFAPVFDRVLGFGQKTYEIAKWEELPVS
jgi:hypothetical protein